MSTGILTTGILTGLSSSLIALGANATPGVVLLAHAVGGSVGMGLCVALLLYQYERAAPLP